MSKLWNFPLQPHKAKSWMILLQNNKSSQVMEFGFRFTKVAILKLSKFLSTSGLAAVFQCLLGGDWDEEWLWETVIPLSKFKLCWLYISKPSLNEPKVLSWTCDSSHQQFQTEQWKKILGTNVLRNKCLQSAKKAFRYSSLAKSCQMNIIKRRKQLNCNVRQKLAKLKLALKSPY